MSDTDRLREQWSEAATPWELGHVYGDFAVVDGKLFAVNRTTFLVNHRIRQALIAIPAEEN